jgi:hypothetical protein
MAVWREFTTALGIAFPTKNFVYSGLVQEVRIALIQVEREIHETGILGEITKPYADSFYWINISPSPGLRLYYGTTKR